MAIKRIQLRGISRTPSDRMVEDGGCAESLNVYLDNSELAPVVIPEDITTEIGIDLLPTDNVVYIHKTTHTKEYIISRPVDDTLHLGYWNKISREFISFYNLGNENVTDIASVGNTLIVSTDRSVRYALFKGGEYNYLGDKIPFPTIEFFDAEVKAKKTEQIISNNIASDLAYPYDLDIFDADGAIAIDGHIESISTSKLDDAYGPSRFTDSFWNDLDINNKHKNETAAKIFNSVKSQWQSMIKKNAEKGIFCNSFWAIYSVRLYDGSLLTSVPQLVSPGNAPIVDVACEGSWFGWDEDGTYHALNSFIIRLNRYFKLGIKLYDFSDNDISSWKDIIKSVDVFISEDIEDTDYVSMTTVGDIIKIDDKNSLARFQLNKSVDESYISSALSKSSFVKVEEFSISEDTLGGANKTINDLRNDYICDSKKYVLNEERFSGKELLSSQTYDMKQSGYSAGNLQVYNDNLYLLGATESLSSGTRWFNAQRFSVYLPRPIFADYLFLSQYPQGWFSNPWRTGEDINVGGRLNLPKDIIMKVSYQVQDNNDSAIVYGRTTGNSDNFVTIYNRYDLNKPEVESLIIYPNPNCKYADLQIESGNNIYRKRVEMRQHPYLPMCSFWYGGDKPLFNAISGSNDFSAFKEEAKHLDASNKLISSSLNNPFVHPLGSAVTFQTKIISAAIATTALSQGQFGQFPLYVFTEDGIWVMDTATDGSLVSQKPLSREVCVNPASITSIDDAVIFVSDKGVMMLKGSTVANISPFMNGRHYVVEESAKILIKAQEGFADTVDALSDKTPFVAFVKKAKVAYDYAGQRLIFMAEDEVFQYVYKIDTQTWHKIAYNGLNLLQPINAYPECLVQGVDENNTRIYNLSTVLDTSDYQETAKGIIITRQLDLGEPDVFKTITDVRVRGQYRKGAVKFILLGSNDGINYCTISTLRGKSWKLFRMIVLADLEPTERISWVDVQYDTRFTNKLR